MFHLHQNEHRRFVTPGREKMHVPRFVRSHQTDSRHRGSHGGMKSEYLLLPAKPTDNTEKYYITLLAVSICL